MCVEDSGITPPLPCSSLYIQVTFRNEATGEFLFYTVSFKVTPSGTIKTIKMTTPVRQSTSASIKLENPLPYSVTFSTECKLSDISLPSQFAVPANSEVWLWLLEGCHRRICPWGAPGFGFCIIWGWVRPNRDQEGGGRSLHVPFLYCQGPPVNQEH